MDLVLGFKNQLGQSRGNRQCAITDAVEDSFDMVRERRDVVKAAHRSRAFDRMKGTKKLVDGFGSRLPGL